METRTARRIEFNEPNTIGLDPALWHRQKPNRFLEVLPYWGGVASLATFLIWMMVQLTVLGVGLAGAAAGVIFAVSTYIPYHVEKDSKKKRVQYRSSRIGDVVQLFNEKGLIIDEADLAAVTASVQSGFRVKDRSGVLYLTDYVWVTEERIKASFFLRDPDAIKAIDRHERENRVEGRVLMLVEKHVEANGDFPSPEHREAFIAGARAAFNC